MKQKYLCRKCGSVDLTYNSCKGNFSAELLVWIVPILILILLLAVSRGNYLVLGIEIAVFEKALKTLFLIAYIYSICRLASRRPICPHCGCDSELLPIYTPKAKRIIKNMDGLSFKNEENEEDEEEYESHNTFASYKPKIIAIGILLLIIIIVMIIG